MTDQTEVMKDQNDDINGDISDDRPVFLATVTSKPGFIAAWFGDG